jgi:preprotein translocase subunit SecD
VRRSLLALLLCVAGPACDNGDDSGERSLLELRPVLATTAPPCPAAKAPKKDELVVLPLMSPDGKVAECLELGRTIVDAADVRSASVGKTPGGAPALSVVLGSVGSANLDGFAQQNQGKRLAILADGNVVSAPEVRFSSFAGRVQVTGLPQDETDDLFRRLNKLIKPG